MSEATDNDSTADPSGPGRRRASLPAMPWLLVGAIALVAGAAAYRTMRDGVGITNDSLEYLRLAKGLAGRARGATIPDGDVLSRRFPPGLPALLAAFDGVTGVGLRRAARLMNVACLVTSTLLIAGLVQVARPGSRWRPAVAAALFAGSADVAGNHINLLSEPLFSVWMPLLALAVAAHLRGGRRRWLFAAVGIGAVAVLTRYAGVALVGAATIAVLLRSPLPRRRDRVIAAALVAGGPFVAMLLWSLAAPQEGAGVGQRAVTFAPIPLARLDQGLHAMGTWITSWAPWHALARTTGVAAIAALIYLLARPRRSMTNPALALPYVYLAICPPFLFVSMTFVDTATPLDLRILQPLHAMAIVVACATIGRRNAATFAIAASLIAAQIASTAYFFANVRQTGMGYASLRWQQNAAVRAVAKLPDNVPLFATHRFALEAIHGRSDALAIPVRRPGSMASLDALVLPMLQSFREAGGRGYVVYLKRPRTDKAFVTSGELGRYVRLQRIVDSPDGQIFKVLKITHDLRPMTTTLPTPDVTGLPSPEPDADPGP